MLKKWLKQQKNRKRYLKGIGLMRAGKQEQAIVIFTQVIKEDISFFDAYLGRAIGYMETEKWEQGIFDLNYVIENLPGISPAYYYRCIGYMELMKTDLAFADINKAIELASNEPANYMRRGYIYFTQAKYDLAIKDITRGIELGFIEDGYYSRAIYFEQMGDYVSAIADWSNLIEISPKNAKAYCRRGLLLEKTGNLQEAISDINIGLSIHDGLPYDLIEKSNEILNMFEKGIQRSK